MKIIFAGTPHFAASAGRVDRGTSNRRGADPAGSAVRAWDAVDGQPGEAARHAARLNGRTAPCDLVIADDPDMSRRHARLVWNGSSWTLEDLDSSNGAYIGEFQTERKLTAPTAIQDGEIFRVGLTRLRLGGAKNECAAAAGAAAVAKGKWW